MIKTRATGRRYGSRVRRHASCCSKCSAVTWTGAGSRCAGRVGSPPTGLAGGELPEDDEDDEEDDEEDDDEDDDEDDEYDEYDDDNEDKDEEATGLVAAGVTGEGDATSLVSSSATWQSDSPSEPESSPSSSSEHGLTGVGGPGSRAAPRRTAVKGAAVRFESPAGWVSAIGKAGKEEAMAANGECRDAIERNEAVGETADDGEDTATGVVGSSSTGSSTTIVRTLRRRRVSVPSDGSTFTLFSSLASASSFSLRAASARVRPALI